jgi:hypothetical protein
VLVSCGVGDVGVAEEVLDDAGLFLAAVEVAAGAAGEFVGGGGAAAEDAVLGVVVEVFGGVQVGAVAG